VAAVKIAVFNIGYTYKMNPLLLISPHRLEDVAFAVMCLLLSALTEDRI
jgi:hypothetical protein